MPRDKFTDNKLGEIFPKPRRDREHWLSTKNWYNFTERPAKYRISQAEFEALAQWYHVPDGMVAKVFSTKGIGWRAVDALYERGAITFTNETKRYVKITRFGFELYEIDYWCRVNAWYHIGLDDRKEKIAEHEAHKAQKKLEIADKYASGKGSKPHKKTEERLKHELKDAVAQARAERVDTGAEPPKFHPLTKA